ncbi:hypothetical protein [Roseiconus lacunae]|uniref:Uncharacterized protein n=1 Tax=Roseiconus lacunae TaxID=2605694 RepID=A0ABT7PPF4_9BACT|nr:hypothetical protein [Roseiconus lacunae]MDM4018169.1 hypothetical protein [Roseiconus lacunae]
MPDNAQLAQLFERQDVLDAWLASDACKTIKRLKTFELSRKVFEGNYGEWERAIVSRHTDDPKQILMDGRDRTWVEDYLVEVTRTFHNLAASAFTLVDHSRKFHAELYATDNLIPDYQQHVDDTFVNPAEPHVVKCLRNYVQHKSLPLVNASFGLQFSPTGGIINWSVELNTARLLEDFDWTAQARSFVEQSAPKLDLAALLRTYRDLVVNFQDWFASEQHRVHKGAFDQRDVVNQRLQELNPANGHAPETDVEVASATNSTEDQGSE